MQVKDNQKIYILIAVATLGYFVDVYALILFSVVRTPSLKDIGVPSANFLSTGLDVLNWQMIGLVVGAVFWGILGDIKGRKSVLFGSILIYSIANILNSQVHTVNEYMIYRFIAGFGLSGELGIGITLVSEVMSIKYREYRGIGTTIIGSIGLLGSVLAALVSAEIGWRYSYIFGGVMGFALLLLRGMVEESSMFKSLAEELSQKKITVRRGDIRMFFKPQRFLKLLQCILVGLPTYFVVGLLITAAPEFGKTLGISPIPDAAKAVMYAYIGMSIGGILCCYLSQVLKSRKKALLTFSFLSGLTIALYLYSHGQSLSFFYWMCGMCGFGVGFWAIINTNTAEQFGTNLRATAATLSPNLIRASLIPIAALFTFMKGNIGLMPSATLVGAICVAVSGIAVLTLEETFGKDLNYAEEDPAKK
jgi:MFS transporter, putative metabolite:H+ symporter